MGARLRHSITATLLVVVLVVLVYLVLIWPEHYGFIAAASCLAVASIFWSLEDMDRPKVKAMVACSVLAAVWFTLMGSLTLVAQ